MRSVFLLMALSQRKGTVCTCSAFTDSRLIAFDLYQGLIGHNDTDLLSSMSTYSLSSRSPCIFYIFKTSYTGIRLGHVINSSQFWTVQYGAFGKYVVFGQRNVLWQYCTPCIMLSYLLRFEGATSHDL